MTGSGCDADAFQLMAAAAANLARGSEDGPEEVEVEWWEDTPAGHERRCTVTFRSLAAVAVREHGTSGAPEQGSAPEGWVAEVQTFADGQLWQPPADEDGPT